MAIIFDEVTADVQTPPPNAPAAPVSAADPAAALDTEVLFRALERKIERQARLKAD